MASSCGWGRARPSSARERQLKSASVSPMDIGRACRPPPPEQFVGLSAGGKRIRTHGPTSETTPALIGICIGILFAAIEITSGPGSLFTGRAMRLGDPQRTMLSGTVLSILLICVTPFSRASVLADKKDLALTFLGRPAIRLCAVAAQQRVCETFGS